MNSPRSNFSLLTGNPQVGRNHHQQLPIGRSNELFLNSLLMKVHINCGGNSRDEYSNTSAPIGKFEPSEEEEEEDRMESTFQTDGNMDQPLDFSRKKDMGGNLDQPKKMMMNGNRNKSKKTKSPLSVSVIPLRSSSHETEDERGEESSSPENSHQSNGINHNGESESNCKSPDHSSPSGCSTTDERAPFMIPGWFQSPNSNYVHDGNSMAANIPLSSPTAIGMNTINNALYSLSNQTAIDAYNTSNGHVSTALFSPDSRRKYTRPFKEYLSNPLNYTRSEQISRLNPIHLQPAASYLDVPGVPERLQQYRQNVFSNRQSNRRERKTSSSNLADINGSPTGTSEGQVASTSNSDDEKCGLTNGGGGASNNSGSESNMSITPTGCSRSARKRGRPLPDDQKDDAYWERRRKNNEAAKRSRDLRRAKEDEVALRASFFEMENFKLSAEISHLHAELEKQKRLNEELMLKQQRINEEYILKQKLYHGVIPPM